MATRDDIGRDLDAYVAGIRATAVRVAGRPGVYVAVPPLPPLDPGSVFRKGGRELRGYLLTEGPDGLPRGARVIARPGTPPRLARIPTEVDVGDMLAFGLLDGTSIVLQLRVALPVAISLELKDASERVSAAISGPIRVAFDAAGFSQPFRDALRCMSPWATRPCYGSLAPLFKHAAVGDRLRAYCLAHPFPAMMAFDEARLAAEAGPVPPPDLPAGVLSRISGPAFCPGDEALSEALWTIMPDADHRAWVLAFLRDVPLDWIPTSGPEAAAFVAVSGDVSIAEVTGLSRMDLVASCKGRWADFHGRCQAALRPEWGEAQELTAPLLRDPVSALATSVVLPLMRRLGRTESLVPTIDRSHPAYATAARLLYGAKALPACIEVAERWHADLQRILAEMPDGSDPDEPWPAFAPDITVHVRAKGGTIPCLVTVLNTARALREEGASGADRNGVPGLGHCVASYRASARRGECHILSVRTLLPKGGYERVATVEVRQREGRSHPEVVQVQVRAGSGHDGLVDSAMRAWTLKRGVRPYMHPRSPTGTDDAIAEACGYDWSDRSQALQAVAAYARFLPRDLRTLDRLEGWLSGLASVPVPLPARSPRHARRPVTDEVTSASLP